MVPTVETQFHIMLVTDLLNIKTIVKQHNNTQISRCLLKFIEENAIVSCLTTMDKIEKVMIVCDPGMVDSVIQRRLRMY